MTTASLGAIPMRQVLGVGIHAVSMEQCVALCEGTIESKQRLTFGVVNAAKLVTMRSDPLLRDSVVGADLIVADGMAVVWASRILDQPLPDRVTGIDLFEALLRLADRKGYSVYLLGAAPEVLAELVHRVGSRHPGLVIAGQHDGYFDDAGAERIAQEISSLEPDMLFVGISTPKKELFLEKWGPGLNAAICHGVGGSFDVVAGKTGRAPEFWRRIGIEWLWRLLQEPRRMWRRYLVTNIQFIALVAGEWLRIRFRRADPPQQGG